MLKSCKYCMRVHDSKVDCGKKPKRNKEASEKNKFRWSRRWRDKSEDIKQRDKYLCQLSLQENPPRYVYTNLSTHHIVSIEDNWDLRLDDENLITLSDEYHKKAERGEIKKEVLFDLLAKQYGYIYPPGYGMAKK